MQALAGVAMVLQDNSTLIADVHSIMWAQWVLTACVLLVLIGLVAAVIAAVVVIRGLQRKVEKLSKDAQAKAMPLIGQGQDLLGKVQEIVADLKPKIASVTTDVTHMTGVVKGEVDHISTVVKEQVDHISGVVKVQVDHISGIVNTKADEIGETVTRLNSTVQDVNGKTQGQVQRVNGIVTEALTATENMSRTIQHGIQVPVIKIAGWVASAKAGIETFAEKVPFLGQMMEDKPASKPPVRPVSTTAVGGTPFVPAADKKTNFRG